MRRLLVAASLVLIAAGAAAQPASTSWQLDPGASSVTLAKAKVGQTAAVMGYNSASPEKSTLAFSVDATTIGDDAVKAELDAAHFPELRLITVGDGRKSGNAITVPIQIAVKDVIKPASLQLTFKSASPQAVSLHAEVTIKASDFHLKGADLPVVIDASFVRLSGN
jgi:polyisoprenoid-binding protein YceI